MAITYILVKLIDETPTKILGFIAIKASSLLESADGIPSGSPALEIAELAVCEMEEGQGYGTMLVEDVYETSRVANW